MRIIIAGGTGQIGGRLSGLLAGVGHEVIILTRRQDFEPRGSNITFAHWDAKTLSGWQTLLDGADAVINLAGENIGGKAWTDNQLERIEVSRVQAGKVLVEAVRQAPKKPGMFLQASAVGFYGTESGSPLDETSGPGSDRLADICLKWEASTAEIESMGVRRVIARTGLVLEKKMGVLPKIMLPFSLFVGGPLGDGKQVLSWIHLDDELSALRFLVENPNTKGVYNLAAPDPVENREFGKVLAAVMKRPFWLPVPSFALKTLLGRQSSLVLEGQRVLPTRLLSAGFQFKFSGLREALEDILKTSQ